MLIRNFSIWKALRPLSAVMGKIVFYILQVLMVNPLNPRVYFDIEIEKKFKGRIVMELFADTVPVTAENFRYTNVSGTLINIYVQFR